MTTPSQISPPRNSQRQRGAAILILVLILMLGLITLFTYRMDRRGPELEADRKTALALAQAKEALLGRAASDNDPGTVSCPSVYLNGVANTTGADCVLAPAPSIIPRYAGRFPWYTLDSGGLYDGAAERLWYVMSPNFIDKGDAVIPATLGTISVNGGPNVVAVIIAPGPALSGQNRSAGNDTIMTNYLESYVDSVTINTALPPGNDRVITISSAELFNLVTQRMARELVLPHLPHPYPTNNAWFPTSGDWAAVGRWNAWLGVANYTQVDINNATLDFTGCAGATYTIRWDGSKTLISRVGHC